MKILNRIRAALEAAHSAFQQFDLKPSNIQYKAAHDPVTDADRTVDRVLRQSLVEKGEGWLSEESTDDEDRLGKRRVWVVDPLDGTREFVAGIPEWCVSIALVENGKAVAGGVHNPSTGETFLGSHSTGVTHNGTAARASERKNLQGALVLASRSEVKRGEWERFRKAPFHKKPVGSIAYKLALVAAGLADATWTLTPKHEWDVAAGAVLVEAGGGIVQSTMGLPLIFNNLSPLLPGLVAAGPHIFAECASLHNAPRAAQPSTPRIAQKGTH